jgi:hypothetical protein
LGDVVGQLGPFEVEGQTALLCRCTATSGPVAGRIRSSTLG